MRFKISRLMAITAIIGVNIAWIRAFLLSEQQRSDELFNFVFLLFFTIQFGLWRYLRTSGRRRRFWLGFVLTGVVASVAFLFMCDSDLAPMNALMNWYYDVTSELSYDVLPLRLYAELGTNHVDWFNAIILFLPQLFAALLGGLLFAVLYRTPGAFRIVSPAEDDLPR